VTSESIRSERFHLGDLLTVTTGLLLSPDHVGGLYRIVDHVAGQPHLTHQLGRAADEIKPFLLEQHPWLADITVPGSSFTDEPSVIEWLSRAVAVYGEYHDVAPMPFGQYVGREPLAELREMAPHLQIITVEPNTEESPS
jgi:hypothetical protein